MHTSRPTIRTAPDDGTEWFLLPFFMVRVAGLPADCLTPLRFPEMVTWGDRVLVLEGELESRRETLEESLESAVGDTEDVGSRRRLLGLRRDIHNRRLPRNLEDARRLGTLLSSTAEAELNEWIILRQRYDAELDAGEQILANECERGRRHLGVLADDPRLRYGIQLASPSLDYSLQTYTTVPEKLPGKRFRKIERALLSYVFRTVCKTSPFSTLTTVALGRFGQATGRALELDLTGARRHSHTRLNLVSLARLGDILVKEPTLRLELPVTVSVGLPAADDRVHYVRRRRRSSNDSELATANPLEDKISYLSRGPVLDELLTSMQREPQVRVRDIIDHLCGNDPENRPYEDVETYVVRLLQLGLLTTPLLHCDIHYPDPLAEFRDRLERLAQPWANDLARRLDLIEDHVSDYSTATLEERRQLVKSIRNELGEAQQELGHAEPATPRTLVYEDVSLDGAEAFADRNHWEQRMLPSLQGLSRILPVFDRTLPDRLVARGFFRNCYGPGSRHNDVIEFVREFSENQHSWFTRNNFARGGFDENGTYISYGNELSLPAVDALDNARLELTRRMNEASRELPTDATELILDEDFINGVSGALPANLGGASSRSFFLQMTGAAGTELGVLNWAYSGLTSPFGRFAHCFQEADGQQFTEERRKALADLQPQDAVYAELIGGYDMANLNLHPSILPYELVLPGEVSFRPETEQIPVDDLYVMDNEEAGELQLWSRRLETRVVPVYLGSLVPTALPEVQRALLTFSGTSMSVLDWWNGVKQHRTGQRLEHRPRIRYQDLVLQRRAWKVNAEDLPQRAPSIGDQEWFLNWMRWLRRHKLPRRIFLSGRDTPYRSGSVNRDPRERNAYLRKPQYVDFDSYFSLTLLDNALKSTDEKLVMTEMLPDLQQRETRSDEDRYVTELVVELDQALVGER